MLKRLILLWVCADIEYVKSTLDDLKNKLDNSLKSKAGQDVTVRYRTIYFIATFLYPAWWFLYDRVLSVHSSTLSEYLFVGLTFCAFGALSLVSSWVAARMRSLHWIPTMVFTLHHFWVMDRHGLNIAHTIGAFVAVTAAASTFVLWRDVGAYSLIVMALTFRHLDSTYPVPGEMLVIGLGTTLLITNIANIDRLRIIQSLKRSEWRLQQSDAKNADILRSIREGFGTLDRNYTVTYINPEAERLMGIQNSASVIGKKLTDLFPDIASSPFGTPFERALNGEYVEVTNYSMVLDKWIELRIYPNENGISVFVRDVSERKKMESAIAEQEMKAIVAAKMSTLGEMAGGVAHEINNPLAIIQVKAQQLIEKCDESETLPSAAVRKAVEKIESTTTRISKIVKALRSFARDGEKDPFEMTTVNSVVGDTLELCRERFKNNGVLLKANPLEKDIEIECRAVQVCQVLLNLVANAFDVVVGLEERWVRLEIEDLGNKVLFKILDSGKGIPLHVQEKMFQPFYTTKSLGKGTGLGLSLSKGIIETHGGSLSYDSNAKNTCFHVILPKKQAYCVPAVPSGKTA